MRRRRCLAAVPVVAAICLAWAEAEELAEEVQAGIDLWEQITTEEWQPGKVGEYNTSVPIKDLECEGEQTRIRGTSAYGWAAVKEHMHLNPRTSDGDRWLVNAAIQIQRDEPDTCVLGVTSTSAYLLPLTMPKFRNMARMLNTDCNFLVLNVTFYDTLRSGFPVFGIVDGLATPEYRAWFGTEESLQFFPARSTPAACTQPAAQRILEEVQRGREDPAWRAPLVASLALFDEGEAHPEEPDGCPPSMAAALILLALARAEAEEPRDLLRREAVLRDVIELVSRAEEIIRSLSWDGGVAFGELVATPWNLWWLLHRLQLAIPRLLGPGGAWKRPGEGGEPPLHEEL